MYVVRFCDGEVYFVEGEVLMWGLLLNDTDVALTRLVFGNLLTLSLLTDMEVVNDCLCIILWCGM